MDFILKTLLIMLLPSTIFAQDFIGSFELTSTQKYKNGNVRNDTIAYFFDTNRSAIKIKGRRSQPDIRMIFNFEKKTITNTFINQGKKGGYILPMDNEHWPGFPEARSNNASSAEKTYEITGEEKEIQGYNCKSVSAENSEYSAVLWISDEVELSMTQILSYQSVGKGKSRKEIELFKQFGIETLPLKMELISKTDKADVIIELVNFKEVIDKSIFDTSEYKLSKIE